jgi:hypothetical protein
MQIRYYTYSKNVMNKAVRHTTEAEPITEWLYIHKEQPDNYGNIKAVIYLYYPSINNGILLESFILWNGSDTHITTMQTATKVVSNPEKYITWLTKKVANANWIGNADIALAMQIDAQKAAEFVSYRESYLTKKDEQSEAQREERSEKERIANAKLIEEEKVMINNLLSVMQTGGEWYNEVSPISGSSILNVIADQNEFVFPIKFKGWVNKNLHRLIFKDGECISYGFTKGHKSTTIFDYVKGLINHLKTVATDEELQHLFGLDKNNA